jgi:hypothetical protein
MSDSVKFYFIYDKNNGNIRSFSTGITEKNINLNEWYVEVSDEYLSLLNDFIERKKKFTNYKIDIESKVLKVLDKFDVIIEPDYNKFLQVKKINKKSKDFLEIVFKICSIDNLPYLIMKYNGNRSDVKNKKQNSIRLYATRLNDINFLYESFYFNFDEFDDNNEISVPINKIDIDMLFKMEFSFYTRKTFKNYGCYVE